MKVRETLKKFGEKQAYAQIEPRCHLRIFYEQKPPAKIQEKMNQSK